MNDDDTRNGTPESTETGSPQGTDNLVPFPPLKKKASPKHLSEEQLEALHKLIGDAMVLSEACGFANGDFLRVNIDVLQKLHEFVVKGRLADLLEETRNRGLSIDGVFRGVMTTIHLAS